MIMVWCNDGGDDSDPAMKQLLLKLNEEEREPFIIEDMDERHLLVQEKAVEQIKARFAEALEENVYRATDGVDVKATW